MLRLFRLDLMVETENIIESDLKDKVNEGLCMACSYLESTLEHDSITYKIKEVVDLD